MQATGVQATGVPDGPAACLLSHAHLAQTLAQHLTQTLAQHPAQTLAQHPNPHGERPRPNHAAL